MFLFFKLFLFFSSVFSAPDPGYFVDTKNVVTDLALFVGASSSPKMGFLSSLEEKIQKGKLKPNDVLELMELLNLKLDTSTTITLADGTNSSYEDYYKAYLRYLKAVLDYDDFKGEFVDDRIPYIEEKRVLWDKYVKELVSKNVGIIANDPYFTPEEQRIIDLVELHNYLIKHLNINLFRDISFQFLSQAQEEGRKNSDGTLVYSLDDMQKVAGDVSIMIGGVEIPYSEYMKFVKENIKGLGIIDLNDEIASINEALSAVKIIREKRKKQLILALERLEEEKDSFAEYFRKTVKEVPMQSLHDGLNRSFTKKLEYIEKNITLLKEKIKNLDIYFKNKKFDEKFKNLQNEGSQLQKDLDNFMDTLGPIVHTVKNPLLFSIPTIGYFANTNQVMADLMLYISELDNAPKNIRKILGKDVANYDL